MINIAVLGTGQIIPEAVEAMQASKKFNVAAIWARPHSADKAKTLAEKFHVEKFTTDLEEILNDAAIDFVYIGLVNSVHFEYAKKCLDAGKNVIVEKPFTTTFDAAKQLAEIATSKKLYLFEAISNIHTPNFFAIQDEIKNFGEIKFIQANFSQLSSRYDDYKIGKISPAFDKKTYGGALRDLNVYNINPVAKLFGLPQKINYTANFGFNGVDTSGILILKYENFIASCIAAKDSDSPSHLTIQGDNGYIKVDAKPNSFNCVEIKIRGAEVQRFNKNQFENRLVHEFIDFGNIFETKNFAAVEDYLKNSLNVTKIVEVASSQ